MDNKSHLDSKYDSNKNSNMANSNKIDKKQNPNKFNN